MKKILIILVIFLGWCSSVIGYEYKSKPYKIKKISVKKKWNFEKNGSLQKFELRHGDAAGFDKKHDGQRIELQTLWSNRSPYGKNFTKSKEMWTAALLKIPNDFPDTDNNGSRTLYNYIFQIKTTTSTPIWDMNLDKGGTELNIKLADSKQYCEPVKIKKNEFNEIITYSNLNTKNNPEINKYFRFWVNGKEVNCISDDPIIFRDEAKKAAKKNGVTVSWGIYRSSISVWLKTNNRNHPKNMKLTCPSKDWEVASCRIGSPFKYEWENKVPTAILFYDKVYMGSKKPKGLKVENLENKKPYKVNSELIKNIDIKPAAYSAAEKKGPKYIAIVKSKTNQDLLIKVKRSNKKEAIDVAMKECNKKEKECYVHYTGQVSSTR